MERKGNRMNDMNERKTDRQTDRQTDRKKVRKKERKKERKEQLQQQRERKLSNVQPLHCKRFAFFILKTRTFGY